MHRTFALPLALSSSNPGWADVPTDRRLTIPRMAASAEFTVTVPEELGPFSPYPVEISAQYAGIPPLGSVNPGEYAAATLIVKSHVVAGILKTLTVSPNPISGGCRR